MADLNSLIVFAKVAEALSFTEAARRLEMPVSTVSRRIADLEKQLGVQLLERSTRTLRLTAVGHEVRDYARRAAEVNEGVEHVVANQRAEVSGLVRLAAPPSISDSVLAPIIAAFQQTHRAVRFESRGSHHCAEGAEASRPEDSWPRRFGRCGFLGVTLQSARGKVLGVLALYHEAPLEVGPSDLALLDVFALRAGAALERLGEHSIWGQTREQLRNILNTIPDPICVKDRQHRFVAMNDAFCRFMAQPEPVLLGKSDYDFVPAHEARVFWAYDERVFLSGQPNENEESFTASTGEVRTLLTKKAPFSDAEGQPCLVCVIRDITDHKRLESQLRLADRMATVGTMAAGVAHEINNPLSYVSASLSFLREQLEQPEEVALEREELRVAVGEALEGTGRVRSIVRDLKTFARADEECARAVDLHQVIEGAQRLVRHQMQHHAHCVRELEPVPNVLGDPARLGQVLVNLLVNALQAFPRGDPARNRIRIRTRQREPGRVEVSVEDNGQGMTPQVLERLFTPFFTTKPAGEGTGLGLPICQSIIQAMDGRIEVSSTPGEGSTFRLVLPCFALPEAPARAPSTRRRLLLVDDDPEVCTLARRLLQQEHDVVVVEEARGALQRILHGERFDAVLCDVLMPGLNGLEFVTELERLAPELARRTGFMTSLTITPQTRAFIAARGSDYLQKPFNAGSLGQFVARLLS